MIMQSGGMFRWAGRLSGHYPEDPAQMLEVEEIIGEHALSWFTLVMRPKLHAFLRSDNPAQVWLRTSTSRS